MFERVRRKIAEKRAVRERHKLARTIATLLLCAGVYVAAQNYPLIDWTAFGHDHPAIVDDQVIADGVRYFRDVVILQDHAEAIVHVVELDLSEVALSVSSADTPSSVEVQAQRVSFRTRAAQALVGMNISQIEGRHGWGLAGYFPLPGDDVDIRGLWTVDHQELSPADPRTGVLCLNRGSVWIAQTTCGQEVTFAAAGRSVLMSGGVTLTPAGGDRHPRSLVGLSGDHVLLANVEGRHPGSAGMRPGEAEAYMRDTWGVVDLLEGDGGGSSSLVLRVGNGYVLANRSAGPFGFERATANALLVYPRD